MRKLNDSIPEALETPQATQVLQGFIKQYKRTEWGEISHKAEVKSFLDGVDPNLGYPPAYYEKNTLRIDYIHVKPEDGLITFSFAGTIGYNAARLFNALAREYEDPRIVSAGGGEVNLRVATVEGLEAVCSAAIGEGRGKFSWE